MAYSIFGIMSIVIHIIINNDIIFKKSEGKFINTRIYRYFLYGVMIFHFTDAFWGIFYDAKASTLLYIDTVAFFVIMPVVVLLWVSTVIAYLNEKNRFNVILYICGFLFLVLQVIAITINFFNPIIFSIGEDCEYNVSMVRYLVFGIQMLLFLMISIHTLVRAIKVKDAKRRRHITICLFGIAMIVAISFQMYFPLLPFYTIGYLVGCCVLHSFVVESQKEEYLSELNEARNNEEIRKKELEITKQIAYTDPLTGVKSTHAHAEAERRIDEKIKTGEMSDFGIIVFDLNGLKDVNDNKGHEVGDSYILDAASIICNIFKHSPVFRIGGDEFITILEGIDYTNRNKLLNDFNHQIDFNKVDGAVVVSSGLSTYIKGQDKSYSDVFRRADKEMYKRKHELKEE